MSITPNLIIKEKRAVCGELAAEANMNCREMGDKREKIYNNG